MANRNLLLGLALSAALTVGCESTEEDGPAPAADVGVETTADTAPEETTADSSPEDTNADDTNDTAPTVTCGDRKVEGAEECDDGNTTPGDGCDASCKFEPTGPDDVCDGQTIAFAGTGVATRVAQVKDDTTKNRHNYASVCGGGSGKDAVYKFVPDVTGRVTAKIRAEYPAIVSARRTCTDPKTEVLCNDTLSTGSAELTFGATAGEPFYLLVDGYGGTSGVFTLDVSVEVAKCGNGTAELPEECDDGNTTDGDGCSKDCKLEGDGSIEDCPGKSLRLTTTSTAKKVALAGDTSKLAHDQTATDGCSSTYSGGADAVYAVTPTVNGTIRAVLTSEGAKASLYARSECTVSSFQIDCRQADVASTPMTLTLPVRAEQTYYVVVDNATTTPAPYTLDVTLTPSSCGNGLRDGDEQCDDGNSTTGDGCDASCKLESMSAYDSCPTDITTIGAITLTSSTGGSLVGSRTGSTAGLTNKVKSCVTTTTTTFGDAVYRVRPTIAGLLTATMTTDSFNPALSAHTSCSTANIACAKGAIGISPETIKIPVEKDTDYLLVAEGTSSTDMGPFRLDVAVTPSVCGNGVLEGGETCDDSNTLSGDGCDATCLLEPVKGDTCSDANPLTLTLSGTVYSTAIRGGTTNLNKDQTFTGCSSGGRDAFYELVAPIDGVLTVRAAATFNLSLGVRGGTTCATTGAPLVCANTTTTGVEEVTLGVAKDQTYWIIVDTVDGSTTGTVRGPFDLEAVLVPAGCGDTLISGGETCDDGNAVSGDGCSSTCATETISGIDTCPGATLTLAGTSGTRRGVITVNTTSLASDYAGSCGGAYKDAVIAVTPPITGTMVVQQKNGSGYIIHARAACTDATTELACKAGLLEFPVTASTPVYLIVDGPPGKEGTVTIDVAVTPS